MRNRRIGALTLGIIFVMFGILFLANNISGFPIDKILQWWPLVLVLLGLEILLSGIINKKNQKLDILSVFLIFFIIIITAGAGLTSNVMQGGNILNFIGINHYRYDSNFTKNYSLSTEGKTKLVINNSFGNVTLEKSPSKKVEINATIQISNNDENYAKRLSEDIVNIKENTADAIEVMTQLPVNRDTSVANNIRTSYKIGIPDGIEVEVQNRFGEITAADISDSIALKNENGSITAENIGGPIKVENSFGETNLKNITANTEVDLKQGNLTINNVRGSLKAENQFGQINIKDITGNTNITNKNGSIEIEGITGNLIAENGFGEIKVSEVSGELQLTGQNGNISVDYAKPSSHNITINNKFGTITLSLPVNQTGHYKAYTKLGSINTDFGLRINQQTNVSSLDQIIASETPMINITNNNGSIDINN